MPLAHTTSTPIKQLSNVAVAGLASLILFLLLSAPTAKAQTPSQCGSEETRFTFGDEVSVGQREEIRNGIGIGVRFLCSKTDVSVSDSSVFAYSDFDKLIDAYAQWFQISTSDARRHWGDNQATAISSHKVFFIYTNSQGWQQSTPHLRVKIIIHELFHILQSKLSQNNGILGAVPNWFLEGSAEYVGFRGIDDAGLYSYSSARDYHISLARNISASLDLATGYDKYVLGLLAVDYLLGNFDVATLAAVWDVSNGKSAEQNFQLIFGRSFAEFYPQFVDYRSRSFPQPTSIPASAPMLVTEGVTMRAAALESATFMRDPFPIIAAHNFSADRRTRVILFARNISGEDVSSVMVQAEDSQQRIYSLPVEFGGKVPNFDWLTQITIRLPDELANAGNVWISIKLRGVTGNRALISIKP